MMKCLKYWIVKWLNLDRDHLHIQHDIQTLKDHIRHINYKLEESMLALENLNKSVVDLQASVDAAVEKLGVQHPSEADIQAAADAVNAQVARLQAALNPAPVATTPA